MKWYLTLLIKKDFEFITDFHISMLKPLLPLMTELVQWSFHHREQVPEALKEVWFSIVNFLDFNEVLDKDVHNETKKMFGGFLDSLLTKSESSLSMYFVQALVNKLVQGTKQYLIEVKNCPVLSKSCFSFSCSFPVPFQFSLIVKLLQVDLEDYDLNLPKTSLVHAILDATMSSKVVSKPFLEVLASTKEDEVDDQKDFQKCIFSHIGAFVMQVSKAASVQTRVKQIIDCEEENVEVKDNKFNNIYKTLNEFVCK